MYKVASLLKTRYVVSGKAHQSKGTLHSCLTLLSRGGNMKIEKYLKNKDITLTNDDIDVATLIKDLQQGMVSESDVSKRLEEARNEVTKELTNKYTELENKYNDLEKRNADLTSNNADLKLENIMTRAGFLEENFKEIATMRKTIYGEEPNDEKAINEIKEKYSATYFPKQETKVDIPSEPQINNGAKEKEEIKVNRNTRVSDLFIRR